nr:MAG TPA: helix-turn-helix domain protein [Herelleviridae sp.]
MDTGELIRNLRIKKGMTQRQLGQACGIDEANIRKYESGRQNPKYETIQKIAAALGVNTLELFPEYSKLVKKNEQNKQDKKTAPRGGGMKEEKSMKNKLLISKDKVLLNGVEIPKCTCVDINNITSFEEMKAVIYLDVDEVDIQLLST